MFKETAIGGKRSICKQTASGTWRKVEDTLRMEKKKWLKQGTDVKQQVENEVMLTKAQWDKEQKEAWARTSF